MYLDVCCLCRPFDNQAMNRIHLESEAIKEILLRCTTSDWSLVTSDAIRYEISRIPDMTLKRKVEQLAAIATEHVHITKKISERYFSFVGLGVDSADALHLACAESIGAIMLTTDDALIKIIKSNKDKISLKVINPVEWLMEVSRYADQNIE